MRRAALIACLCAFALYEVAGKQDPKLIKCYNEKAGGKFQQCWKDDGFETCFTKFSPDRKHVMLRGCSSRKKMFFVECENHISENRVEEFCFCSYDFCNSTTKTSSSFSTLALIYLIFQFHICQNSNLLPSTYCLLLFTFGLFSYVTNASCLGYLALASLPFLGAILTNR